NAAPHGSPTTAAKAVADKLTARERPTMCANSAVSSAAQTSPTKTNISTVQDPYPPGMFATAADPPRRSLRSAPRASARVLARGSVLHARIRDARIDRIQRDSTTESPDA